MICLSPAFLWNLISCLWLLCTLLQPFWPYPRHPTPPTHTHTLKAHSHLKALVFADLFAQLSYLSNFMGLLQRCSQSCLSPQVLSLCYFFFYGTNLYLIMSLSINCLSPTNCKLHGGWGLDVLFTAISSVATGGSGHNKQPMNICWINK